jgi:uncharacterized membrane protein
MLFDRTGLSCISSAWALVTLIVVILMMANSVLLSNGASLTAYGQTSTSRSQTWIDKENNIKISFSYKPSVPIVDKSTELKFNITDLRKGNSIDSSLVRVVITNGQRTFKFPQVTVHNGTFSVNYLFPDIGTYQSIIRIDSDNFSTLASFQVFVPFQASVNLLANYGFWIIISIIGILAFVIFFIRLVKRRNRA